ncbi:MAG: LCP family protein [Sakamotonia sp.]
MNYEDELERSRARKSRRRESTVHERDSRENSVELWSSAAEPGSRASRSRAASGGTGHGSHSHNSRGHNGHSSHRRRKNSQKKKLIIGILAGILALVAVVLGAAYAYLDHHMNIANKSDFDKSDVTNLELSQETRDKMEEGFWTIAIFGVDSRDNSTGKGNQSDVIMIANIDRKTGEIKLVSVYRDTYLNINDRNVYNKINAAYAEGGPQQAIKAINKNLDLNITQYVTFNWKAVATGINILGGVDIEISKAEHYYINAFITETVKGTGIGSVQIKQPGMCHMDGVQAVAYGRLRLMDSDYARTERQRLVIQKAFEKAVKSDLATLNSLVGNMAAMCETNIETNDVLAMAKNVTKYHLGETMGFPAARGEQRVKIGKNNLACVIPQTLVSNVTSLHSFLFGEENYTPSSTVQTISKKISDVSGLHKAGEEIGHVATDKGYVPKSTTTAAPETESAESSSTDERAESSSGSEGETSEGETLESSEGEAGSTSESGMHAGGWESQATDSEGNLVRPSAPSNESTGSLPQESSRPQSPLDVTKPSENYGPGFEDESVTEATTAGRPSSGQPSSPAGGGPAGEATVQSTENNTSVIIVPPAKGNGPSQAAPSSPADMTLSQGNTGGPSGQ